MTAPLTRDTAKHEKISALKEAEENTPSNKFEKQSRRLDLRMARKYITRPIMLIFCVLGGCLGLIVFAWSSLQDIERALPITIAKQERDVALLVQDVSDLAWLTKLSSTAPSAQNNKEILDQIARIESRLGLLRGTYSFDNLVGASAMHAVITPALNDIKLWMSEGIQGVPANSPMVRALIETRATDAIQTMRPLFTKAQQTTFSILNEQSTKILNFRNSIVFFLLGILLTTVIIIFQMYRLKKIEHSLFIARETAEKANKAKSEFLATMSHEFRTPLNAILGFSEMMQEQYFGPLGADKLAADKYYEYTNDIHHSGRHLLSLVNDILDVAAIEAGKRYLSMKKIDTEALLRECLKSIEKRADDSHIKLKVDIQKGISTLYADKRSVAQIVLNLLSNAIKFTDQGGVITLSAAQYKGKHDRNKAGNKKARGFIEITVKDTGIGIASDRLPTITDPFIQADSNPHRTQEGTGLGLSIAKALIEAHDGSLHISSDLGEGTEVTFLLPC